MLPVAVVVRVSRAGSGATRGGASSASRRAAAAMVSVPPSLRAARLVDVAVAVTGGRSATTPAADAGAAPFQLQPKRVSLTSAYGVVGVPPTKLPKLPKLKTQQFRR